MNAIDNKIRFSFLVISLLMLSGCSWFLMPSPEVRWQRSYDSYQETLANLYPVGMTQESIRGNQKVRKIKVEGNSNDYDWFMSLSLDYLKEKYNKAVKACDIFTVQRGSLGLGIYWDYVFYDENDLVMAAFRRFID